MEYKIVHANDRIILADKVNTLLKNGWELQGGVAVDSNGNGFYQAVTKKA